MMRIKKYFRQVARGTVARFVRSGSSRTARHTEDPASYEASHANTNALWRRSHGILLPFALFLLPFIAVPLHGQTPLRIQINPQNQAPSATESAPPTDPYWEETVARAVKEFASDDPEIRRSAVMLLGKYPVPPAREVIGRALNDPDAGVRQAALVSVLEEPGQFYRPFANRTLALLDDPSVSIRRIASSSIAVLLQGYPLVLRSGSPMQREFPENVEQILQDAFRDEDVSVRQNMVTNYPLLRIDLPEETVVALLHDPNDQVAIHTIQWGLSLLSPDALARELRGLVQHENPTFRLELVRALGSVRFVEIAGILEKLQNDPHPPVALEAMLRLFSERPSVELYERMMEHYREHGGGDNAAQRLIFGAQLLGEQAEPFLREWMQANDPANRQRAVQFFLNRFGREVDPEFLLSLLDDPVEGIRQQAMRNLLQQTDQLSEEEVRQTVSSRHPDVREAAAALASLLPPQRAEELLMELLLDEASQVRLAALQQIGRLKISGWEEIMSISLQVDDPLIARAALSWLIRNPTPETLGLLQSFLQENPNSPFRSQIEAHLKRQSRQ